ncbi:hypothetical protein SDC9_98150 [bioreactor metagenome]|uniref:Uncharacterized protein n=1 Tax=bioreactor metagenome TaxID=1076179 RepID=A0A645ADW6_9ZZZZ
MSDKPDLALMTVSAPEVMKVEKDRMPQLLFVPAPLEAVTTLFSMPRSIVIIPMLPYDGPLMPVTVLSVM